MAGNVTGNIGQENVLLENAATESTLAAILAAIQGGTKEQKQNISNIVQKAGLDPAQVEQANQGMNAIGKTSAIVGGAFAGLNAASNTLTDKFHQAADIVSQLTDNQGKSSVIFENFSRMGGVVGLVATGFGAVAKFQEQQLSTYQQLTQNGINFSGSLTQMRLAASNMYLTMEEFSKLMKDNSANFAKMGVGADDGAKAFVNMSTNLMKGPMGRNLQALGYTAEQVNSGLATFLEATSNNSAEAMKDQKKLTASAAEYLTQLDALSEITGKTKEEQLNAAKERAANAAWEAHLMTLSAEERAKAEAAAQEAFARGGKGAEQALMSASMGFPPMTKAAREYTALAGNMNQVTMKQAAAIKDSTKSVEDMRKGANEYSAAAVKDKQMLGVAGQAIVMQGSSMATTAAGIIGTANRAQKQGAETAEKAERQLEEVRKKQKARQESEAADAVDTQRAVMRMGQTILEILLPAFQALQPIIKKLADGLAGALTYLKDTPGALDKLKIALAAVTAGYVAYKTVQGIGAVKSAIGGIMGGPSAAAGTGVPLPGGAEGPGKMIGGVADGLGKVGPMLTSLGKGAGGLFEGIMRGIAGGLQAFANPTILLGAGIFSGAIAIIGAGIAGATWILGEALPNFAEGLSSFNDIDGEHLGAVGDGVLALGAGLAVFGAGGALAGVGAVIGGLTEKFGSFFGVKSPIEKMKEFASLGPELAIAGESLAVFNKNLAALLEIDSDRIKNMATNLKNLATTFKELKEASKPVEQSFFDQATSFLKEKLTAEATAKPKDGKDGVDGKNVVADIKPVTTTSRDPVEILRAEVATLNNVTVELLRAMRETRDNTKSTANILASNGNLFRRA